MNLRMHRILKGLTQWDFGLKLGRSQTQISLMERGYIIPNTDERNHIAEILQVDLNKIEFPEIGTRTMAHQSTERLENQEG